MVQPKRHFVDWWKKYYKEFEEFEVLVNIDPENPEQGMAVKQEVNVGIGDDGRLDPDPQVELVGRWIWI